MFLFGAGSISGTEAELSELLLCRIPQLQVAIAQIKQYKVADVVEQNRTNGEQNTIYTISCRRSLRTVSIKKLRMDAGRASGASRRTKREQASTSTSTSISTEGVQGEILLTEEQAVAQCNGPLGIPPEFGRYVFGDWESRNGRDASGTSVKWSAYARKRWSREQDEWRAGIHKGQKKVPKNQNPQTYFNEPKQRGSATA